MAKSKNYDKSELSQKTAEELLKIYNTTAERLNKQITRLKKSGLYDESSALYNTKRAPVYRTSKARQKAVNDVQKMVHDILNLQSRTSGALTMTAIQAETTALKKDLIIMLKGSHIGKSQIMKDKADAFWTSITPDDLRIVKQARAKYSATSDSDVFYEIMRRLKIQGEEMPEFNTVSDITTYLNNVMQTLPDKELPYGQQAVELAKKYTKRW